MLSMGLCRLSDPKLQYCSSTACTDKRKFYKYYHSWNTYLVVYWRNRIASTSFEYRLQLLQRSHNEWHGNGSQQWQVHSNLVLVREVNLTDHRTLEESLLGFDFRGPSVFQSAGKATIAEIVASLLKMRNGTMRRLCDVVGNWDGGKLLVDLGQCTQCGGCGENE
jgi:hypothetical protein